MSKRPAPAAPEAIVAQYSAMVGAVPGAVLKGAALPYTSVNGNMHSFLDKAGVVAVRLSEEDRVRFLEKFGGGPYVHETGAVMAEYVSLPGELLADTKSAADWLRRSLAYATKLKAKPTSRKKAGA